MQKLSFSREPAVWIAAIEAIIVLLVAFGVPITGEQKAAILGVISPVIALAGGFAIRSQVSPSKKVKVVAAAELGHVTNIVTLSK